jgi:hypothetical protein
MGRHANAAPFFDFHIGVSSSRFRTMGLPRTMQVLAMTSGFGARNDTPSPRHCEERSDEAILGVPITPLNPPYFKGEMQRVTVLTSDF